MACFANRQRRPEGIIMERWVIVGLVGGLFGGILIAVMMLYSIFQTSGKRKEEMKSAALRLGFEFEPRGGSIVSSEFAKLPLLKNGLGIRNPNLREQCENVIRGTRGAIELTIFDFRYSTGGQGAGRKMTVAAFRSDNPLPAFKVQPRGLLGMHIAGRDNSIRFYSDPVFAKDYLLTGTDEPAIRVLLSRDVRQILSETGRKWAMEAKGNALLVYLQRQQASPEKLAEFMEIACRVAEVLLNYSKIRS